MRHNSYERGLSRMRKTDRELTMALCGTTGAVVRAKQAQARKDATGGKGRDEGSEPASKWVTIADCKCGWSAAGEEEWVKSRADQHRMSCNA